MNICMMFDMYFRYLILLLRTFSCMDVARVLSTEGTGRCLSTATPLQLHISRAIIILLLSLLWLLWCVASRCVVLLLVMYAMNAIRIVFIMSVYRRCSYASTKRNRLSSQRKSILSHKYIVLHSSIRIQHTITNRLIQPNRVMIRGVDMLKVFVPEMVFFFFSFFWHFSHQSQSCTRRVWYCARPEWEMNHQRDGWMSGIEHQIIVFVIVIGWKRENGREKKLPNLGRRRRRRISTKYYYDNEFGRNFFSFHPWPRAHCPLFTAMMTVYCIPNRKD